ncbi:MAG: hypothetical protein J5789_05335 [Oscillospiraceae bacterium]|nr:hypothetical protein [Oscillospiraceae bacterium]
MDTIHALTVHGKTVPSNVFFAPINPGFSRNGIIQEEFKQFFKQRTGNHIGICYIGNVALQAEWVSNADTAVLYATPPKEWQSLAAEIRQTGTLPGIQLAWKPGEFTLQRTFTTDNAPEQIGAFRKFYEAFTDFEQLADLYAESIRFAASLGFSVVQLHAAHGYGLSLLLSRRVSGSADPGETKGARLIKAILSRLSGLDVILDIRLSLFEGIDDRGEIGYKKKLAGLLVDWGFDIISFSNGFYNIDKNMIYPSKSEYSPVISYVKALARQYPTVLWNVAGNMEKLLVRNSRSPDNLSFSIGRQLIADPQTVSKVLGKDFSGIKRCSECGACHYYSFGYDGIGPCKH